MRISKCLLVCAALTALAVAGTLAEGQTTRAAVENGGAITLSVGRSSMVQAPWPAKRVSISNPKVADIQVLSPRQVLVSAKSLGSTDLILWNENEEAQRTEIQVTLDQDAVAAQLKALFPDASLELRQSGGVLLVSGALAQAEQADLLHKLLDASGMKYVDLTHLAGVQQVQIKVMIAEANRVAIRSLGINAFQTGQDFFGGQQVGPDVGGALNPITIGGTSPVAVSPTTSLFAGFNRSRLLFFVQALAENQYLRVLAEPSLTALSGQEASFLAGGEFPIPVVQGAGASTSGTSITIEYKEFGVRLHFRPTVLGDGTIRLHVAPEVSELSNGVGSVQIEGFNIPAILTRKAETTIDMNSGQTFGMAGLISRSTQARSSRIPGLGELPVLGSLFRSVRYQEGDTELLLLVTASLAEPLNLTQSPPLPGFTHTEPNDWEVYSVGRIDGVAGAHLSEEDARWLRESGLQRLRGPGAWTTYDSAPAASQARSRSDVSISLSKESASPQ